MDIKKAIKGQYRAGLAMLRQCITDFPDELWEAGMGPRKNWKIVYHTLFYTHLYAMQREGDFEPWGVGMECDMWEDKPGEKVYSKADLLEYCDHVDSHIEEWVDRLDLEAEESGFNWYPNFPKLDHQLLNIRHLGGHMGQLSELAMNNGVHEIKWCSRVPR
ncbi:MAG: DinB family protein [Armatimonadetes bacterium]|nr:DinB family protein [Armatimonadota bacterium]